LSSPVFRQAAGNRLKNLSKLPALSSVSIYSAYPKRHVPIFTAPKQFVYFLDMTNSKRSKRRVLIIGSDGMRADGLSPDLMPTYSRLMGEGTLFSRFSSVYPSETRVAMTSLTTGVYPGKHGLLQNGPYLRGFGADGRFQTGNHEHLLGYSSQCNEPLVFKPTLGDRLHAAGRQLSVAGSGSPGSSLLWNILHPEKVININTSYGAQEMEAVHRRLGPAPKDIQGRLDWLLNAFLTFHLPDTNYDAMVFWMNQPDGACHDSGLGSPGFCDALRRVDQCVGRLLKAVEERGEEMDVLLVSDHGHSSIGTHSQLGDSLDIACQQLCLDREAFVVSGPAIYDVTPVGDGDIQKLVGWFREQQWCGAVFARHPQAETFGALPLEFLYGPLHHQRAPLLIINPTWSPQPNEHGVRGTFHSLSGPAKSTHGSAIATDMHAFCLGWGPSFKKGHRSELPCGLVDIAPTVCHLLDLEGESGFDGRVLHEGLVQGAPGVEPSSQFSFEGSETQREPIQCATVNGTRYILGAGA